MADTLHALEVFRIVLYLETSSCVIARCDIVIFCNQNINLLGNVLVYMYIQCPILRHLTGCALKTILAVKKTFIFP